MKKKTLVIRILCLSVALGAQQSYSNSKGFQLPELLSTRYSTSPNVRNDFDFASSTAHLSQLASAPSSFKAGIYAPPSPQAANNIGSLVIVDTSYRGLAEQKLQLLLVRCQNGETQEDCYKNSQRSRTPDLFGPNGARGIGFDVSPTYYGAKLFLHLLYAEYPCEKTHEDRLYWNQDTRTFRYECFNTVGFSRINPTWLEFQATGNRTIHVKSSKKLFEFVDDSKRTETYVWAKDL